MTFSHRPAQQRPGVARLLRVAAAIVMLCQAAAWVHAAAIPHVTCLEHGESVHLAAPGQPTPDVGTVVDSVLASAPDEATAHAHEHCSLQGHRSTRTPPPALSHVAATVAVAVSPPAPRAPRAVGILRLAPKTSPPRAAVV